MINKKIISDKVKELGFKLGNYDNSINRLDEKSLTDILSNLEEEYTDVYIIHDNVEYAVEISTVDNEKDLQMLSRVDYESRYGQYSFVDKFDLEDE